MLSFAEMSLASWQALQSSMSSRYTLPATRLHLPENVGNDPGSFDATLLMLDHRPRTRIWCREGCSFGLSLAIAYHATLDTCSAESSTWR